MAVGGSGVAVAVGSGVGVDVLSDSAIDSLAPGEGEKKPTDDAPDTSEMAKLVMARQASGRDVLRLQKLIAQQMEQAAPKRKPRRSSSSRKDDGLKSGGAGKATVVI